MEKTFSELVLDFLGHEVLEFDVYGNGNEVNMNLRCVNHEAYGLHWSEHLTDYLSRYDHEVNYTYANGNWCSVIKTN